MELNSTLMNSQTRSIVKYSKAFLVSFAPRNIQNAGSVSTAVKKSVVAKPKRRRFDGVRKELFFTNVNIITKLKEQDTREIATLTTIKVVRKY